jgi:NADPH:quinone reductase-like Zn-dependent oxidoreductase
MKAFVMEAPGDISDMKLASVYIPKPAEGEIRVKVMAAGLNPVDYKRCLFTDADFPCILGADVAGVVTELGSDVTQFRVGDRVHFHANVRKQYGGFAEFAQTTAATTVRIPEGLSFAEAAAIPCAGWTAYLVLYHKLKVQAGQSILITGAGGGVGCFAIQLAKLSGLTVFASTQPHKADYVKSLGADHVLSSNEADDVNLQTVLEVNNGALLDHALDTVGPDSALNALRYLKLHGNLCSLAALVSDADLFAKGISLHYVNIGGMHQSNSIAAKLSLAQIGGDMGALFATKQLRVPIMEACSFEQIPVALETLRAGQVQGKLVANFVPPEKQEAEAAALALPPVLKSPEATLPGAQAAPAPPSPSQHPLPPPVPQQQTTGAHAYPPPPQPQQIPVQTAPAGSMWHTGQPLVQ